jgi:class 3 adenylate cyclase
LAVFSGPARAIRCALTIKEAAKALDIKLRTGLHVGEIEKDQQDISGINVNLASRIQSVANADQVLVSDVLKSLAFGSGLSFQDLGDYELKGFDGKWRLSEANTADA